MVDLQAMMYVSPSGYWEGTTMSTFPAVIGKPSARGASRKYKSVWRLREGEMKMWHTELQVETATFQPPQDYLSNRVRNLVRQVYITQRARQHRIGYRVSPRHNVLEMSLNARHNLN